MIETMQQPMTRAEFERRLHLLREQIRRGKMLFPKGMKPGLEKLRYLPNGRIDFLSVDESARLQANMIAQFQSDGFKEMAKSQGAAPTASAPEHTEDTPAE